MKIRFTILLCVVVLNASAQTTQGVKTIFGNGKPETGFFLNPFCQFSKFAGPATAIPGLGAGIILNKKLSMNLLYKFTITENTPDGEADQLYLHGQWFGLKAEYAIKPERIVHVSFPLEVGVGEIEFDIKDSFENIPAAVPEGEAWFANIEPGIAAEINVWKYIRLSLATGYRFVSNVNFRSITENDLKGFTFSAGLKIGLF
jgi:hypothetical protein